MCHVHSIKISEMACLNERVAKPMVKLPIYIFEIKSFVSIYFLICHSCMAYLSEWVLFLIGWFWEAKKLKSTKI